MLNHTGATWNPISLVNDKVAPGGLLALAIYIDQGFQGRVCHAIKCAYVKVPALGPLLIAASAPALWGPSLVKSALRLQPGQ